MLSRRSVRIKAMQLLFSVNRDKQLTIDEARKRYWGYIEDTFSLYLLNLYCLIKIAQESTSDMEKRGKKHLPSDQDKTFKDKIFNNSLVKNLDLNPEFQKLFRKLGFEQSIQADYFQTIYNDFSKLEMYDQYLLKESKNEDHLEILLELYRFCRQNEMFNEIMEDHYGTWNDDKSVVVGAVKKTIKSLPSTDNNFFQEHRPADDTVNEFGFNLFLRTLESDDQLLKYIEPNLKNWDSERLAIIDMILLKMALCEMMNFSTIPTKVTINEYVEIAKNYSTAKSKEFINGVLDKIMKDFQEEGLIQKSGRGLEE